MSILVAKPDYRISPNEPPVHVVLRQTKHVKLIKTQRRTETNLVTVHESIKGQDKVMLRRSGENLFVPRLLCIIYYISAHFLYFYQEATISHLGQFSHFGDN